MPDPMAICLEDLDVTREDERHLRCVALPGGVPGLGLDSGSQVRWMPEDGVLSWELWVSADGRLVLLRHEDAAAAVVRRGGRSVDVPTEKPVILLDQDLLGLGGAPPARARTREGRGGSPAGAPRWPHAQGDGPGRGCSGGHGIGDGRCGGGPVRPHHRAGAALHRGADEAPDACVTPWTRYAAA